MSEEILIQRSEEILGGTPVFAGTRVPVQTLIVRVLEKMKESLLAQEYESAA
jgi:uncharacterized protein (DUF433 family)